MKTQLQIKFEPRDIWVGVYWTTRDGVFDRGLDFYVCILPMLPIIFRIHYKPLGL